MAQTVDLQPNVQGLGDQVGMQRWTSALYVAIISMRLPAGIHLWPWGQVYLSSLRHRLTATLCVVNQLILGGLHHGCEVEEKAA